jgi:hypothetical protein
VKSSATFKPLERVCEGPLADEHAWAGGEETLDDDEREGVGPDHARAGAQEGGESAAERGQRREQADEDSNHP